MKDLNQQIKRPPDRLREFSKILDVKTEDRKSGIIFESIGQVCEALEVYAEIAAGTEERRYMQRLQQSHGLTATALHLLAIDYSNKGVDPKEFVEDLTKKVAQSLRSQGYYNNDCESQVFGSPLFNCMIDVKHYKQWFWGEKKYILSISRDAEQVLAERLGRNLALDESRINGKVSIVDSQWFHLDMAEVFSELKLKPYMFRQLSQDLSRQGRADFSFMYDRAKIDVVLEFPDYLQPNFPQVSEIIRPKLGKKGNLQTAIAGPALISKDNERIEIGNPDILFNLRIGNKYQSHKKSVFDREIATLTNARSYLTGILQKY